MFRFNRSSQSHRLVVGTALIVVFAGISSARLQAAGTLYLTAGGYLWRASTEGDCHQMIHDQPDFGSLAEPAVDPVAGKVYFFFGGTIRRCDFDGANSEMVYPGPLGTFDIDRVNRKLYWGEYDE